MCCDWRRDNSKSFPKLLQIHFKHFLVIDIHEKSTALATLNGPLYREKKSVCVREIKGGWVGGWMDGLVGQITQDAFPLDLLYRSQDGQDMIPLTTLILDSQRPHQRTQPSYR